MSTLVNKFLTTAGFQMFSKGFIAISGIIFARYLGPEEFGQYTYIMSIVIIAGLPVAAGLPNLLIREVANSYLDKNWALLSGVVKWSSLYVLKLSSLIIAFMIFGFYFDLFDSEVRELLWIAIWIIPLRGLLIQQGAVLNGLRQPVLSLLPIQIFLPLITLTLLFLLIYLDVDYKSKDLILITIVAFLFTIVLSKALLSLVSKKEIKNANAKYERKKWNKSLLPFAIVAIINTFNTELAVFLLGWLGDVTSVAYFKVAMQVTILISLGLSSVNTVIMPNVARYFKIGDIEKTQRLLDKSVRLSMLVTLPILLLLVFFGDFFINLLFGSDYLEAYPILIVLCVGQFINVFMGSVGVVLYMTHNEQKALKLTMISLAINVVLLVLLIPIYSEIGAAIATSFTMIVWNILMAKEVKFLTGLMTWFSSRRYYAK